MSHQLSTALLSSSSADAIPFWSSLLQNPSKECFTNHDQTLTNHPRTITSDHFSYDYNNWIHTKMFEADEFLYLRRKR
ncbi:hypothetical protein Bca101_026393 [Brassica carinata]